MLVEIDSNSKIPIYLQIYEGVVSAIARNELSHGDILPSARKLAKDLGINYHTSNKAYNLLEMEGFVRIEGRRTTVLTEIREDKRAEFVEKWNMVEVELIKEAMAKGLSHDEIEAMFTALLNRLSENMK